MRLRLFASIAVVLLVAGLSVAIALGPSSRPPDTDAAKVTAPPPGMVVIPAGRFRMGWQPLAPEINWPVDGINDEAPVHEVYLRAFYIDTYEVTNRQFAEFVAATGYRTTAELNGSSWVMDPTMKGGWGYGYRLVEGAYWAAPQGLSPSMDDKMDHPVVHVSWDDAKAFADWAGKRLPTEAEWEKAARGGLEDKIFPWGVSYSEYGIVHDYGRHMNWHGDIRKDLVWSGDMLDGFAGSAPVGSFPPNGYGLYDMAGNVFELVNDWYDADYYSHSPAGNPKGPKTGQSRILRGGSWSMCECFARAAGRVPVAPHYRDDNTGFRLAADVKGAR